MAYFDYYCDACEKQFEIQCGMNDDRGNVKCPDCNGADVRRIFSSIQLPRKTAQPVVVGSSRGSSCSSCVSKNCASCG